MKLIQPLQALLLCVASLIPGTGFAQQTSRASEPARDTGPHSALLDRAAESRTKGSPDAAVLVYEIADFQCPFCAQFATDIFPHLDSAYIATGRVQWVFVNLPMPSHPHAWIATEAALCAGAVSDRFWIMHDRLFVAGREWISAADPAVVLARYAREAGVDMDAYTKCVDGDRVAQIILQDVIFGSRVTGTPTFVVSNRSTNQQQTLVGVKSVGEWREVLDMLLRAKD
ncbi:MAG: thioredoxin domain-containing protein [Gemmatimonadetes bacterium]|nr:thioredoxin domain-containing protein [Gemmatimonadota bacterium]